MRHAADFIEEVWREVNVILQDLADEDTAREMVDLVYRKVDPRPVHTEAERKDQLVALIEATRDLCVAHLLSLARADRSHGDAESRAACLLLRFFEPKMRVAVRRRIGCGHDLEPVVNDVRLRVWRALPRFEGGRRALCCYINRACESACIDLGRRTPNGEQLADPHCLAGGCEDDSQQHNIVELKVFLRRSLPLLRPRERLAVKAFLFFDGNWAAAQEALGIPRQTLAHWFKAALRHLRKLWGLDG